MKMPKEKIKDRFAELRAAFNDYPMDATLDIKSARKKLQKELALLQRQIKVNKIPVLIIFEGWESSGKGSMINTLIQEIDPRSFKVNVFSKSTEEEERRPFLWRFWYTLPEAGDFAIYDKSYYSRVMDSMQLNKDIFKEDIRDISNLERQLSDSGVLIIKLFLHLSHKEQKKRIKNLANNPATRFRVSRADYNQIKHREFFEKRFMDVIEKTRFEHSPWYIIDTEDEQRAKYTLLSLIKKAIESKLEEEKTKEKEVKSSLILPDKLPLGPLDEVDLNATIEEDKYREKLKKLQKQAQNLAYRLYINKIPGVIVFEGWDAAGKGGAIKRLARQIDPRGYQVFPVAAPNERELNHHYMWRFYQHLPKTGHISMFDRSWYGRVMVERIEGFATQKEVERAYREINEHESHWANFGMLVIKFFIHITPEIQLERFQDRQNDPKKQYKITEEDWRNREKWDQYYVAINEMIEKTDTENAPWIIIPGNSKYYARIKVLESFVEQAKKVLERKKG